MAVDVNFPKSPYAILDPHVRWRPGAAAYGNAIVPQVAAEFIKAYMIVPAKAQKATAPAAASVTAELLSHE